MHPIRTAVTRPYVNETRLAILIAGAVRTATGRPSTRIPPGYSHRIRKPANTAGAEPP